MPEEFEKIIVKTGQDRRVVYLATLRASNSERRITW